MRSLWEEIFMIVISFVLFFMMLAVVAFFVLLGIAAFFVFRFVHRKAVEFTSFEFAPARLFDAPREARWVSTYQHWLYQLWKTTGVEFHTSPERIMTGSVIVSVGAFILTAIVLSMFMPATAPTWFLYCGVVGVVMGVISGWKLAQPAQGWYPTQVSENRESNAQGELGSNTDHWFLVGELMDEDK